MNRKPSSCVLCARFTLAGNPPPAHGYCEGYERFWRHDETNEACPLWNRAKDEQRRRAWAEQLEKA